MLRNRFRFLGVLLGTLALSSAAVADKAAARGYFVAGQKAFAKESYAQAARAFERAFDEEPHPAPLVNAADAWQRAGEFAKSARLCEKILALEGASEEDRQEATERLANLSEKIGTIEFKGQLGGAIVIGGETFDSGKRFYVLPGLHTLRLADKKDGRVVEVEVLAGQRRTINVEDLEAKKVEPEDKVEKPPISAKPAEGGAGLSAPTWIAYGAALAGAGAAVYFGLQVNDAEQAFDENPNREDFDRFNRNKLLTNVSLGVAVVGAGLGTYFLISDLGQGSKESSASARVGFRSVSGGAMLNGELRF